MDEILSNGNIFVYQFLKIHFILS